MERVFIASAFFLLLLFHSGAWPVEVHFYSGQYGGHYRIDDFQYVGDVTLDLEPGRHEIRIATTGGFDLTIDEDSKLSIGDDASARAVVTSQSVRFLAHPVTIRLRGKWKRWWVSQVTGILDNDAVVYLVPGSSYEVWFEDSESSRVKPDRQQKHLLTMDVNGKAFQEGIQNIVPPNSNNRPQADYRLSRPRYLPSRSRMQLDNPLRFIGKNSFYIYPLLLLIAFFRTSKLWRKTVWISVIVVSAFALYPILFFPPGIFITGRMSTAFGSFFLIALLVVNEIVRMVKRSGPSQTG